MSTTLPPMTGTGVLLQFIFPFDRSLPRAASVVWRRRVSSETVDTTYARISQGGDSLVAHEQVTFPGDAWAVLSESGEFIVSKAGLTLLYLHSCREPKERKDLAGNKDE